MRAALACLALGTLVACGGGGGSTAGPKRPVGPAIDPEAARQGASDLVTEIYETLGRGNKDSLFTLLEDSLMVFGPRGGDMLGTRADALVALGQVVDPKAKKSLAIRSSKLDVVTAPRGHSAVVFDGATLNGQPHTILAVLTNTNDLWLVGAVAVAHTPSAAQLKAELAKDAVVPPGAVGAKKIDPAARAAVDKFQRGLLDQAAWGDELASHADAIVIGPLAGEVARGKDEIRELWKQRLDARTRAAVAGEITAAVTGDGQLAWVSAPITRVEGEGAQPLPLRAFAVYERAGDEWSLVALNESLAFSEPGAGAPFKRFLPPKPVEPRPEVIADRPKAKEPAKAKEQEPAKVTAKADDGAKAKAAAKAEPPKAELPKATLPKATPEAPQKQAKAKERKDEVVEETPRKKAQALARSDGGGDDAKSEEPKKKGKQVKAKEPKEKAKAKADAADEAPRKKKRTFAQRMSGEADAADEAPAKADEKAEEAPKEASKKKAKKSAKAEDSEAEEAPKKAKKTAKADEQAEQAEQAEAPKKKAKKTAKSEAEEAEEAPKKKPTKAAKSEAEEAEAPPKKAPAKAPAKAKPKAEKAEKAEEAEEAPKKKKPAPAAADDDEVEVIE